MFQDDMLHPKTITPDNPLGIYTIRATGSYQDDKIIIAQLAKLDDYELALWRAHHIEYNIDTNQMRMQFADPDYHLKSHFGGAGQFNRLTGFTYGTKEAMEYCKLRNIEYLIQLIQNSKR